MMHKAAHKDVEHPAGQVVPGRTMSAELAVGLAEGWEEGSEEEVIEAWQYLHDTGLAYKLQGWFGRTATQLLYQGIIHGNA